MPAVQVALDVQRAVQEVQAEVELAADATAGLGTVTEEALRRFFCSSSASFFTQPVA